MKEEHCYRVQSLETEPFVTIDSWKGELASLGMRSSLMVILDAIFTQAKEIESAGYLYTFVHTHLYVYI